MIETLEHISSPSLFLFYCLFPLSAADSTRLIERACEFLQAGDFEALDQLLTPLLPIPEDDVHAAILPSSHAPAPAPSTLSAPAAPAAADLYGGDEIDWDAAVAADTADLSTAMDVAKGEEFTAVDNASAMQTEQ